MFAQFDYDLFPIVIVTLGENLDNDSEFQSFLNEWTVLYMGNKPFTFVFNTSWVSYISPRYCLLLSMFIKNINKKKNKNLLETYVIISKVNNIILKILDMVFYIQEALTPVYITNKDTTIIVDYIKNPNKLLENTIILKKYIPMNNNEDIFSERSL